jgi:hypothetical protein
MLSVVSNGWGNGVGSTGGDDGIVGTNPEGGGESSEVCDGNSITTALDVDDGFFGWFVVTLACLRCSACDECLARTFSMAKLTRVSGEEPVSESQKRGREEKRITSVTRASKSGRIMTVNPVSHAI